MRDRSLWIVGGCYVAARLLVTPWTLARFYDSAGYEGAISFTGAADRLWLVPLIFRAAPDRATIALHAVVSALAFLALAVSIASTIHRQVVRVGVMAVVLLIGMTPRVVAWDAVALSESLAISLTMLLIAVAVRWRTVPGWAIVAVFVGWVFVRDAHALIGAAVAVPMVVAAVRHRRRAVAVAVVVVSVWGVAATQNNRYVEGFNAMSFAAFKVAPHDDRFDWFVEHGMPAFDRTNSRHDLRDELMTDPAFMEWAEHDGTATVARWLLANPGYVASAVPHLLTDDPLNLESAVDRPRLMRQLDHSTPVELYDDLAPVVVVLSLIALAGAVLVRDRRWWLPGLLALSAIPHTAMIYHAVPLELARHGLVMTITLLVSLVWMLALTLDTSQHIRSEVVQRDGGRSRGVLLAVQPDVDGRGDRSGVRR